MEEIDLKEIFYYIFKKKIFVILSIIVCAIAGILYTKFMVTPMYSSYTTVVLSKPEDSNSIIESSTNNSNSGSITQNDITLNQKLVSTYSEIMKSRSVAEQVINELNLNISENELMSNISISTKDDTEMLKISVSNKDPQIAAQIANSITEVFKVKIREIYNIENVTIIDKAIASTTPYNVNYLKNSAIFGIIGGIACCGILFLMFYFDTRIKSKEEVEELLNLEVLAVIPEIKE